MVTFWGQHPGCILWCFDLFRFQVWWSGRWVDWWITVVLLLSPVNRDLCMEHFKEETLEQVVHKFHKCFFWFCHMSDTFMIRSYKPERLERFLDHVNNVDQQIPDTIEMEKERHLPVIYPCWCFTSLFLCCLQVPGWTTIFWVILCFFFLEILSFIPFFISLSLLGILTRLWKVIVTTLHISLSTYPSIHMGQRQAVLNMVLYLWVPRSARNFLTNWGIIGCSRRSLLSRVSQSVVSQFFGWFICLFVCYWDEVLCFLLIDIVSCFIRYCVTTVPTLQSSLNLSLQIFCFSAGNRWLSLGALPDVQRI